MLGVRNPRKEKGPNSLLTILSSKCGEIWLNELRLTDFDESGGYAANGRLNVRLADFANVNLSGSLSTVGFGLDRTKPYSKTKI